MKDNNIICLLCEKEKQYRDKNIRIKYNESKVYKLCRIHEKICKVYSKLKYNT